MKSSPFKLFSLSAREADQRGNYANPELGRYKATTFDHPDLSGIKNSKPKAETEDSNTSSYQIPIKEWSSNLPKLDTSVSSRIESINSVTTRGSSGTFANNDERKYYEKAIAANMKQGLSKQAAIQKYRGDHNIGDVKRTPGVQNTYGQRTINGVVGEEYLQSSKPINMNGSPVKYNAGAIGSIASADPLAGAIPGIGQQINNQAQQRGNRDFTFNENKIAAGTLGNQTSMGVQNQIYPGGQAQVAAEQLASQAATSQRADEMDLIGNPDSVLAMKGTPLHTKGHGGAEGHTHAEPGDNLDQTVAENMSVFDIEDYNPIQKFKEKQIVVHPQKKDTIFSQSSTFVIPKQMEGITRSPEGTPEYKPVYINQNKKQ